MNDIHPDIVDLLVQRATEGISDEQQAELDALLTEHGLEDTLELDLAAAAAANAFALQDTRDPAEAPKHLRAKLSSDADAYFGQADSNVVRFPGRPVMNYVGWAAAATLALALLFTYDTGPEGPLSPGDARESLLANVDGTEVIPWAVPDDPEYALVDGNVVWNDDRQEGYLLLTNMPVNDPATSQYQLWIVDPDRDANPVDGGVFDIPPGAGPVVVPIDAKLAVSRPVAFAITREQPGGVVVSEGPLLVVASAG